ncbi:MAG: hypothetical protein HYZ34_09745 [Ignavibacteriae bacterium]|nr:hypothetical protein [Ignavibacteriota bacterium]
MVSISITYTLNNKKNLFDRDFILADAKKREKKSGRKIVSFAVKKKKTA